jgi:K+-sensing histidine kinase KdpD
VRLKRRGREDHERELLALLSERQKLFEKIIRIQRSISLGAPLQEIFDAVAQGAAELTGQEVVSLRLIDEDNSERLRLVSTFGLDESLVPQIATIDNHVSCGGRAIRENRLVVMEDYAHSDGAVPALVREGLQSAMAAPVSEKGTIVGCLTVASFERGRNYSHTEQEALRVFAEQVSLALTEAQYIEGMRRAQRDRDMFMAMVSHEMKTPLTVITGIMRTLETQGEHLPDSVRIDMITTARRRCEEMATLLNQILDGSRAELSRAKRYVHLPELIADSLKGFDESRRLAVGDVPDVTVGADEKTIARLVGILLENAVSHSPEDGELALDASVGHSECRVTISNPGSLPDDMDPTELFAPFTRGSNARSHGVGPGLYIASRLAEAINARIDLASNAGTVTFTLRFPVAELREGKIDLQDVQSTDVIPSIPDSRSATFSGAVPGGSRK